VAVRGGSMMASMAAQLRQSGGGGNRVAPPGGCSFYSRWRRLAKAVQAASRAVVAAAV
jgi:hypothetical protein